MRPLLVLAIALGALGSSRGPLGDDLTLTVRPVDPAVSAGAEVSIEARVWNAGPRPRRLIVPLSWPNAYFFIEVHGPDGRALSSHIRQPHDETPMELRGENETSIPALGFVGRRIVLSWRQSSTDPGFDFGQPGVYKIVAAMSVFDPDTRLGVALVSDTVEVRIRP